jgi:5,10-methylene-tetrahydrofolate dehydrogenase/methenyl tetrahydrofolate cyclohydrolase
MKNIFKLIKSKQMENHPFKEKILSGVQLSNIMQNLLAEKIIDIKKNYNNLTPPKLKIIQVGDRSDSTLYIKNKLKLCNSIGIEGELKLFKDDVSKEVLLEEIENSNNDININGIIIQLPLPKHLEKTEIVSKIDINKDVDGLHPTNLGNLLQLDIDDVLVSPTTMGVVELLRLAIEYNNDLERYNLNYLKENIFKNQLINLSGYNVTVIGRGLTAGLPISLIIQKCNGTVTLCHSKTRDLKENCINADIIISAVGKKNLILDDMVKDECIIIDVAINIDEDTICGDVDFDRIIKKAKYITPVPGGVGKMTVFMLLKNVIKTWSKINSLNLETI